MVKGSLFTTYFILFIGGLILAILLVYAVLWGGIGIAKSWSFYDTKAQAQRLSSLISAASSFSGNFYFHYHVSYLTKCTVNISQDEVKVTIPSGAKIEQAGGKYVIKKTTSTTYPIIKPDYIIVKKLDKECNENGISIYSEKIGDEISFQ